MDDDDPHDDERSTQVRNALLKALAAVVIIGLVIALGTTIMVRALDLKDGSAAGPVGSDPSGPSTPLPTTALPVPGQEEATDEPSDRPSPKKTKTGRIQLDVSPLQVRPMERINLTGSYRGGDNIGLEVQRFEDGTWSNFGVDATVRVGTFTTYVQTGRPGEQRFRMFDPKTQQSSNVVMVTVG